MSAAGCVIGPRPFVGAVQVRNAPHAVPGFYWLLDVGPPEAQIGTFCTGREHHTTEHGRSGLNV